MKLTGFVPHPDIMNDQSPRQFRLRLLVHFRHHDAFEHSHALGGEYGDIYTK